MLRNAQNWLLRNAQIFVGYIPWPYSFGLCQIEVEQDVLTVLNTQTQKNFMDCLISSFCRWSKVWQKFYARFPFNVSYAYLIP